MACRGSAITVSIPQ